MKPEKQIDLLIEYLKYNKNILHLSNIEILASFRKHFNKIYYYKALKNTIQ